MRQNIWKSEKYQRVPPLEKWKIFVSDFDEIQNMHSLWLKDYTQKIWVESETKAKAKKKICLRFHSNFVCEILRPWGFQILSFIKKKFFLIFSHFHLMLEDPQKFLTSDFSNFLVKNVKSSFTGSWQIPKGTKSWNLVNLPLTAR